MGISNDIISVQPEIRDSGEINAFLLAGEATHLTQEEKIIQEEEQRNLAYANATLKELLENVNGGYFYNFSSLNYFNWFLS